MKTRGVLWVAILSIAVTIGGCGAKDEAPAASGDSTEAKGIAAVDKLAAGDLGGVVNMFDATMAAALPEPTLKQTWDALTAQLGAYQNHGAARVASEQGFNVVYIPCTFERGTINAKIVFGADDKVAGLFFQP